MKRLALLLAAALTTAGCYRNDCPRSATIDWSFRDADGNVTASCTAAGVRDIDLVVNGAFVGSFDCLGPAVDVALGRGQNQVIVEARDASRVILYRDQVGVNASACGDQGIVQAQPSEGRVSVGYAFTPVNACYTPGPSFIWVRVRDEIAGEIAADSSAAPETGDVCGVNAPLVFRLASGTYTLLSTEEMIRGGTPGTYLPVGADCTDHRFTVATSATTAVSPLLGDAVARCP